MDGKSKIEKAKKKHKQAILLNVLAHNLEIAPPKHVPNRVYRWARILRALEKKGE